MSNGLAIAILAAGKGTRMGGNLPKCMHEIAGKPMVSHAIDTAKSLNPDHILCIMGEDQPQLQKIAEQSDVTVVYQKQRLGTGHAVQQLQHALQDFTGTLIVTYGDTPLISKNALEQLSQQLQDERQACAILGFRAKNPAGYGRLIINDEGYLTAIIEEKDATDLQKTIDIVNSGVMAIKAPQCWVYLDQITNDNQAKEYYLTDYVHIVTADQKNAGVIEISETEAQGVNTPMQLAKIESQMQDQLRQYHLQNGVVMRDPSTVHFSMDTKLEAGVIIEPYVVFGKEVQVGSGSIIKSFSHIEGAVIDQNVDIGPYARLRPGSEIHQNARIGNFVEVKKSTIDTGAKVNHLSYIGDSFIGEKTNIGAGTITCNYDGFSKFQTYIGNSVFVGSNTAFVAPVSIGDESTIGAGSVITTNVEAGSLALTRAERKTVPDWSIKFRKKYQKD